MKPKIVVASTSFLLPKNPAWKALGELGETSFADYGDYATALTSSAPDTIVILVLFCQDLAMSGGHLDALLEPVLGLLQSRLAAGTAPTIAAVSSWTPASVIACARGGEPSEALGEELRRRLAELRDRHPSLYTLDLDRLFGSLGFAAAFDARNWYFAHCRLSQAGIAVAARQLAVLTQRFSTARKKVLVLDCDNTLWGGVVGEDGWAGVRLGEEGIGRAFVDFQRAIRALAEGGVLVALCSKNNAADVWELFERNTSMLLRKDDIVASRINWVEKSENLAQIAAELGLGLDSFVFWDDYVLEREMVKSALPMVEVVDVPDDVALWPQLLASLDSLQALSRTDEDRNKASQYRARAKFVQTLGSTMDKTGFLKSIEMKPRLLTMDDATLARAHQLIMKTNQFNLRSVRHSQAELVSILGDSQNICALGALADRYGEHGIVALIIVTRIADDTAFLDTFLMSCRVLGRRFETWLLHSIAAKARAAGIRHLVAEYVPSSKNGMCAAILPEHGFVQLTDDTRERLGMASVGFPFRTNGTRYMMDLENAVIPSAEVFSEH